jgi:hypothetical protein
LIRRLGPILPRSIVAVAVSSLVAIAIAIASVASEVASIFLPLCISAFEYGVTSPLMMGAELVGIVRVRSAIAIVLIAIAFSLPAFVVQLVPPVATILLPFAISAMISISISRSKLCSVGFDFCRCTRCSTWCITLR